jgi:dipeptidyl aminopeptidase/acylaminoacyl peptidase
MAVVFSEPVSTEAVDPENLRLLNGSQPVPTTLTQSGDGLTVDLVPLEPLKPGITYTILVTTGVVDLVGDGLLEPYSSEFSTDFAPGTGAILVTTNTLNNLDPDGLIVAVDGAEVATLDPSGFVTIPSVARGDRELSLSGIAPNCVLEGQNPRAVSVSEASTASLSYAVTCTDPPDGRILFHHSGTESAWISVMNTDGSGMIDLIQVKGGEEVGRSDWSPDGSRIAFSDYNGQGGLEIYLMNKDASGVATLREGGDGDRWERYPSWDPQGAKIVYESRDGLQMTLPGAPRPEPVFPAMSSFTPQMPDWSESGSVYGIGRGLVWSLSQGPLVYKRSHSSVVIIRDGHCQGCKDEVPLWSPGEGSVLFRRRGGGPSHPDGLWVWDCEENTEALLVEDALWFDWSPDGTQIVYTDSERIFVMDADGSGRRLIRSLPENFDEASEKAYSRVSWGGGRNEGD